MEEKTESLELNSSRSTLISLEAIREGEAGLNARLQSMLNRALAIGDFASFKVGSLEQMDLAYLTAKTGHEFAILRGKDMDILFHGDHRTCKFPESFIEMMMSHKLEIVGHSHPGEEDPVPSRGDRIALKKVGQKRSMVVSGRTGRVRGFGPDEFEDFIDG